MLDDMFLSSVVNTSRLTEIYTEFIHRKGVFCELNVSLNDEPEIGNYKLRNIPINSMIAGINCAFWMKDFLDKACIPGRTIWKVDSEVRRLNILNPKTMFYLNAPPPALEYMESVKGGFWKPDGVEYLALNNMKPDLLRRPCPPQGRDWFSKLYRSLLKRVMKLRQRIEQRFGHDMVILPFRDSV